jgi:uncharacterized metal-binding protein
VAGCLARHGVVPFMHLTLTELGVKKKYHKEFNEDEATTVFHMIVANLAAQTTMMEPTEAKAVGVK